MTYFVCEETCWIQICLGLPREAAGAPWQPTGLGAPLPVALCVVISSCGSLIFYEVFIPLSSYEKVMMFFREKE